MNVVDLYREIGRTLHDLGAYRAVLLNAKATPNEVHEMSLQVVVDGLIDVENAVKVCKEKWETIQITLMDLNDYANIDLMKEVIEDGVQI